MKSIDLCLSQLHQDNNMCNVEYNVNVYGYFVQGDYFLNVQVTV